MPSTSRRSPNATLVNKPAIDEAAEALENLPEKTKEKLSLREAVDVLRDQITAALDKGYSYEDIAAMLEKQDITIAPSSLKHYLARSNRQLKQETGTQTRRKRAVAKPAEAEPENEDLAEPVSAIEAEPEAEPAPKRRGRPPASEATPAATKTRSTAARTKSVPTATGTRKRRGQA
jgi:IS30 family transposase